MKKFTLLIIVLFMCIFNSNALTKTISTPIDRINYNNSTYEGGEIIFELLKENSGEKYFTMQVNDIHGNQIFGDMLEGPFRCVNQTRDTFKIGNVVLDSDVAEVRAAHTFFPKEDNGKIWRFAVIAINGKPSFYEISEWDITEISDDMIHYRKTGKKAIINYTRYSCIKPIVDMMHQASDYGILWFEESD